MPDDKEINSIDSNIPSADSFHSEGTAEEISRGSIYSMDAPSSDSVNTLSFQESMMMCSEAPIIREENERLT